MSGTYERLPWDTVLERADALPTLEEQIAYLEYIEKEDRLYYGDLMAGMESRPTYRDKLEIEIGHRNKLLSQATYKTGQETHSEQPSDPLRWRGTQEQLAYLIYLLKEAGFIKSGKHWKQTAQSFVDEDGQTYKSDQLKSIAGSLGFTAGGASSTRAKELEEIMSKVQDSECSPE